MKYPLYNYQQETVDKVYALINKGVKRILCQLPTRAGKSLIATHIIEKYTVELKESVWFWAHTKVLISQMSEELTTHGIKHGIIAPYAGAVKYRCQVISKDTLKNRYNKMKKNGWRAPKVIIIDETHLAKGKVYQDLIKLFPDSIIIGLTATPVRLDGMGLNDIYQEMIIGPSIKTLQAKERLCPVDTYITEFDTTGLHSRGGDFIESEVVERLDKPKVLKGIVNHWESIAKNKKTLTFCASISHAKHMAEEFNNAGYPSVAVSSEDDPDVIARKVRDYYAGKYINLVSVSLFIMGFTVKDCECIIQARPTQSLMIYLQTVGRGMVYLPGKRLINLDCVNNKLRHGLPEDDRHWTLKGKGKKDKEKSNLKRCIMCLSPVPKTQMACPTCGFNFNDLKINTGLTRTPEEVEGKLIKVS